MQHSEKKTRILIIEDNPGDVRLLTDALSELKASVEIKIATDGAEALKLIFDSPQTSEQEPWQPDLIFLDLNLPKVNGHEVLARLKTDRVKHLIPVIILSSSRAEIDINRAYAAHANAYVRKPTSLDDLNNAVKGLKAFWIDTVHLPKLPNPLGT